MLQFYRKEKKEEAGFCIEDTEGDPGGELIGQYFSSDSSGFWRSCFYCHSLRGAIWFQMQLHTRLILPNGGELIMGWPTLPGSLLFWVLRVFL